MSFGNATSSPCRLAVSLCFALVVAFAVPAGAQLKPWCAQNPLDPNAQPYPAPTWSDLGTAIPDYHDVTDNFRVAQSLRLLATALEKALEQLRSGGSLAGKSDIDGACLCNCNVRDVSYWTNFLSTTVKTEAQEALQKTQDRYLSDIQAKIDKGKMTLEDTVPGFKKDLEGIIKNTCETLVTCDPTDPNSVPEDLYEQGSEAVQGEFDKIFGPHISAAKLKQLKMETEELRQEVKDLLERVSGSEAGQVLSLQQERQRIEKVIEKARKLFDDLEASTKALATLVKNGDPQVWKKQIEKALTDRLGQIVEKDGKVFEAMKLQIRQKINERIQAIKAAAEDIYKTATDGQKAFDQFKMELANGLLDSLDSVEGCYGVTKRKACSIEPGGFCAGTSPGQLFGSEKLELPLWIPTEVFKDGKTALRYALESIDWLEKVRDYLATAKAPDAVGGGKLADLLKDGDALIQKLNGYVNTFTEGYHLGAYSDIRPDLHMCVGWAGHGALAEIFSTANGDFRGGASYLSANLVKKHRAQFRAGGFALFINGRTLPLAPGLSLNLQMDGFRLWDKNHPFGIQDVNGLFAVDTTKVKEYDAFNLVDQDQLGRLCCQDASSSTSCGPCTLNVTSFLYNGFFPVSYGASREWPRPGVETEKDQRVSAVFGAGVNLDLEMKTRYWSAAPIPVFPGATIIPWLSLGAGINWLYGANHLRGILQEKINQNLSAASKLGDGDFKRDQHAFQAPDVTEDVGNGAHVNPKLGADLVLGIDLARFLRVGITANLFVGVDVKAGGFGGVLDLSRSLTKTLAQSNPKGDNCKPKIEENVTRTCSNETFKKKDRCANVPAEDREDCIDLSKPEPAGAVYSTKDYGCTEKNLACDGGKGYCTDVRGKIVLHDVTRDQCEAELPEARCVAVHKSFPGFPGVVATDEPFIDLGPPVGILVQRGHQEAEVAKAQAVAAPLRYPHLCASLGWCYNWGYRPDVATPFDYAGVFTGTARTQAECPAAHYQDDRIILQRGTNQPLPSQFVPFEWQAQGPMPDPEKIGRTFHTYQCVQSSRPEVTGFEGPDCNPIEFGYPSACPGESCSCDPKAPSPDCAAGRTCVDGACLTQCGTCGAGLTCRNGACEMTNEVPFAEQIVWRLRNASQPQHTVASYSLDKLITSVVLGFGVRVGLDYKLFRSWKSKNLFDFTKSIPLVSFPFVKHQLGLEAQYQDDCDLNLGEVTNHQPDLVKRHPGGVTSSELVAWCKPRIEAEPENPSAMAPHDQVIGEGIEESFKFATEIGLDFWGRSQLCVGDKTWDQYFGSLKGDPASLWPKLSCSYLRGGVRRTLSCVSPGDLQGSLVTVLGCLDAAGPDALPRNTQLLTLLRSRGQADPWLLTPGGNVFDLRKLLVDDEGEILRSNLDPFILGMEKDGFPIDLWLQAVNVCVGDAPAGRLLDVNLDVSLGLGPDDFQPCGGVCCSDGVCYEVATQSECPGTFQPGTACFSGTEPGCLPGSGGPPPVRGACILFGQCQEVASPAQCQGSFFYAGMKCENLESACATSADCASGTWCRPRARGGRECVPFQSEGGSCSVFTEPSNQQICAPGLLCTDFVEDTGDLGGFCRRTCAALPVGLAAWWPLDEPAGPKAAEFLAKNDGLHVAGPTPVTGAVGRRALRFDGVDDFLEIPNHPDLNFGTGDFSFAAWIRTSQNSGVQSVLDKRRNGMGYHLYLHNGRLGLQLADGRFDNYTSQAVVSDGAWHFVAVTVERGRKDGIRWYLDGTPVGPPNDPTGHPGSLSSVSPLRFAVRTVSRSGWWNGALDEPALFNRVLTPAEVLAVRKAGSAGLCKCIGQHRSLEAYWPFEEGTDFLDSLSAGDASGHGHTGEKVNGPASVPGRVGRALAFDGVDDWVRVPPAPGLNPGLGELSLEGWIQTSDTAGTRVILSKRGARAGYQLVLLEGRLALHLGDGEFTLFDSGVAVADGQWHHVAVTVERRSRVGVRFYVDGKEVGQRGNATLRHRSLDSPEPLRFGTRTAQAGIFWKGKLDEMTVYRRLLLPEEVTSLYRAGKLGRCAAHPIVFRPAEAVGELE
jgi:hypothetical protein